MCRPTDNSVSCRSLTKITELLQLLLPLVNWAFSCNPALKQHLSTCNLLVNTVIWGAVGSCFVFVNCKWYFVKNLCSITIDYWICELTASALALASQHKIFRPSFGGVKNHHSGHQEWPCPPCLRSGTLNILQVPPFLTHFKLRYQYENFRVSSLG